MGLFDFFQVEFGAFLAKSDIGLAYGNNFNHFPQTQLIKYCVKMGCFVAF